jgi:hypothetical protein
MTTNKAPYRDPQQLTLPCLIFASFSAQSYRSMIQSSFQSNGNPSEGNCSLFADASTIPRRPWRKSFILFENKSSE